MADRLRDRWADRAEIVRSLMLLIQPGAVAELRIPHSRRGTISGYYSNMSALARDAAYWSGAAPGVYITPNPVNPVLLARACNRSTLYARHTTGDLDVTARRWLLVDFDPERPSGISATEDEHRAALARAEDCRAWLEERGWPAPVVADSGNGGHLLYRIELANDDEARDLLERCLKALAFRWDDETVSVDQRTYNAGRIWKLYGTLAAKGDSLPERPHRLSRLLAVPDELAPVAPERLQELATLLPPEPKPEPGSADPGLDLRAWIAAHSLPVFQEIPWRGGTVFRLNPCPWNPDHNDRASWIALHAGGHISAGCFHNGCVGRGFPELRDLVEPGWREQQERVLPRSRRPAAGIAAELAGIREQLAQFVEIAGRWTAPPAAAPEPRWSGGVSRSIRRQLADDPDLQECDVDPDEENERLRLLADARSAAFPAVRVLEWTLDSEAAWHAFCAHPEIGPRQLRAAAVSLRAVEVTGY